jgi:hypothetical protein
MKRATHRVAPTFPANPHVGSGPLPSPDNLNPIRYRAEIFIQERKYGKTRFCPLSPLPPRNRPRPDASGALRRPGRAIRPRPLRRQQTRADTQVRPYNRFIQEGGLVGQVIEALLKAARAGEMFDGAAELIKGAAVITAAPLGFRWVLGGQAATA